MRRARSPEDVSVLEFSCPFLEPVTPYIDPATAYTPVGWLVVYNVYERLIERRTRSDGTIELVPSLAESWEVSADSLRYRFRLRDGPRFASGRNVDADAVRFSLERLVKMGENPPRSNPVAAASSRYVPLKAVEVLGKRGVELVMKERWATTLMGISTAMCSIIDRHAINRAQDMGHAWLRRHSAGSGPYVLDGITEHRVVLTANGNHWGRRPKIKKVVLLDGPDPSKEETRLRRGAIDASISPTPEGMAALKRSGFSAQRVPTLLLPTLTVTKSAVGPDGRSLAENREFASALKYGLDYDAIAGLFGGWSSAVAPAQTSVLKGMDGYSESLAYYYRRDLPRAKELLTEAGYPKGLEVDLTFWKGNWGGVSTGDIVDAIGRSLREVGIRSEPKRYSGKDYFEIPVESLPGITLSMSGYAIPDPDDLTRRRMTWINISGHDYRAEDDFAAALREMNRRRRSSLYRKLQGRYLREGPGIYLLTFPFNVVVSADVRGYRQEPHWSGPDFSRLYFASNR